MGREIRRVPPNWEHPKMEDREGLQPMYDRSYETERREWLDGLAAHKPEDHDGEDYWEWDGNPPERAYYRPWADDEATWYQLWETVTEGTPVSPPFETKRELAEYLAEHGDYWDQERGDPGWGMDAAAAFVKIGYAPSFMGLGGRLIESKDIPLVMERREGGAK